nr:thiol protease aleurain-like [Ipomoea batatas]
MITAPVKSVMDGRANLNYNILPLYFTLIFLRPFDSPPRGEIANAELEVKPPRREITEEGTTMVRLSVFVFVISALIASVTGSNAFFTDDNPIRQVVSDSLHELESSILQVIGSTRHACCLAHNCNGGSPSQAFEYIKYNGGLDTKKAYPYIGENGVFSVAFEVVDGFKLYESGVYTNNSCGSDPMDVNHVVLAVGYGVENGTLYWLIKNSWGEDLGDHGYFKMEMGKNTCGVATCASFPFVA